MYFLAPKHLRARLSESGEYEAVVGFRFSQQTGLCFAIQYRKWHIVIKRSGMFLRKDVVAACE